MKTMMKSIAVLGSLLLLAGCGAAAEDVAPRTAGPGWRHEQMAKAWEKGELPGPMMMMRGPDSTGRFGPGKFGPGARGYGPPVGADGKIDASQLPEWCPLKQAPEAPATK